MVDNPEASQGYTQLEAEKMGYDWEVVQYFLEQDPKVLEHMWGNGSAFFSGILMNTIDSSELISSAQVQLSVSRRYGMTARAGMVMAQYRLQNHN